MRITSPITTLLLCSTLQLQSGVACLKNNNSVQAKEQLTDESNVVYKAYTWDTLNYSPHLRGDDHTSTNGLTIEQRKLLLKQQPEGMCLRESVGSVTQPMAKLGFKTGKSEWLEIVHGYKVTSLVALMSEKRHVELLQFIKKTSLLSHYSLKSTPQTKFSFFHSNKRLDQTELEKLSTKESIYNYQESDTVSLKLIDPQLGTLRFKTVKNGTKADTLELTILPDIESNSQKINSTFNSNSWHEVKIDSNSYYYLQVARKTIEPFFGKKVICKEFNTSELFESIELREARKKIVLIKKEYSVPPDFMGRICYSEPDSPFDKSSEGKLDSSNKLTDAEKLKQALQSMGIAFPAGATIEYDKANLIITMINTSVVLDQFGLFLGTEPVRDPIVNNRVLINIFTRTSSQKDSSKSFRTAILSSFYNSTKLSQKSPWLESVSINTMNQIYNPTSPQTYAEFTLTSNNRVFDLSNLPALPHKRPVSFPLYEKNGTTVYCELTNLSYFLTSE